MIEKDVTAMLANEKEKNSLNCSEKEKNFKLIDLMGSIKTSKFSFYIAATFFAVVFLSGIKSTLISKFPFVTLISNFLFASFIFTIAWWGTLLYTSKGTMAMACDDEREYIKSIKEKQIKWILIFLYWPIFTPASVFYTVIILGYMAHCAINALKSKGIL